MSDFGLQSRMKNHLTGLSILIPAYDEEGNIRELLREINEVAMYLTEKYEVIVMDGQSRDKTVEEAERSGAKVFIRSRTDFATYLTEGLPRCKGDYIITLDSDQSHPPKYIKDLWKVKDDADVIICSKWIEGGEADMSQFRILVSKSFNLMYKICLGLNVNDMNSNYRLYNSRFVKSLKLNFSGSEILPAIIVEAIMEKKKVKEIPFHYAERKFGKTKFNPLRHSFRYVKTLIRLWKLKHDISTDFQRQLNEASARKTNLS